jgi:hypothetical protein
MLVFWMLTLVMARLGDALGLCDALIEELGEEHSTTFCSFLTNTKHVSRFNNATSNITVLAFNDTSYTSNAGDDIEDQAATIQYYMLKGIHNSTSFPTVNEVNYGQSRHALIDTYLESGQWAIQTGGQKLLVRIDAQGQLVFTTGGYESSVAVKTVSLP